MSIERLTEIVHSKSRENWHSRNKDAFESLFGSTGGRFPLAAKKDVSLRAPEMNSEEGVQYAAFIHAANATSGPFGGTSFVMFPVDGYPCLLGLGIGTQGLSPDERILGRPGHARKVQAICRWLNGEFGNGTQVAWAKHDPTRTEIGVPPEIARTWSEYGGVFGRYGGEVYALFRPTEDKGATASALTAFVDLLFEERGFEPIASAKRESAKIKQAYLKFLTPKIDASGVTGLLDRRKYVILQGPPGVGKTKLATELIAQRYGNNGKTVQFHANTTYETFVGGLAPSATGGTLTFSPKPGFLMEAAAHALRAPEKNFLLHIDEINRADLGKIMGEAILLLEPGVSRSVRLQYDFGAPFHQELSLPANLHILGTMNSADRSIAIVDIAVRRRFAFLSMWPDMQVVDSQSSALMKEAFERLTSLFVEHASNDAFELLPGHSYFLANDDSNAKAKLKTELVPLLNEYLAQGYVSSFGEPVRAYIQWVESL